MTSSVQEIVGLGKALDRLEARIREYRKVLSNVSMGCQMEGENEQGISTGEVETIEALICRLARRVTGAEPDRKEWEPLHAYCSGHEDEKSGWADQNREYFRWALLWLEKTRTYLEYLSGVQSAEGAPYSLEEQAAGTSSAHEVRYDVALSFAGEDRGHARQLADSLVNAGFSVFYDEYERATLWGRNLYSHLSDVYQNKARYCLMFVSSYYARKLWTKRERESAQARAFRESREYILPLRLDDTALPGIEETVGYIDLRTTSHEEVMHLLIEKLRAE